MLTLSVGIEGDLEREKSWGGRVVFSKAWNLTTMETTGSDFLTGPRSTSIHNTDVDRCNYTLKA